MAEVELTSLVNLGIVDSLGLQATHQSLSPCHNPLQDRLDQADHQRAHSGDHPSASIRGVLICGLPRSGTTAFAKVLEKIGFDLGRASGTPVAELASLHPPLKAALQGDAEAAGPLVQALEAEALALSSQFERYVIKLPDYYRVLNRQRLPRGIDLVIFVTRDPLCVAVRNSQSVFMDPEAAVRRAVREYAELIDIASACSCPSLLVSYEKLLAMPRDLLPVLAQRLGVSLGGEALESAISSVVLNDQSYLASSSLSRGEFCGQIGFYRENRLGGWCFWSGMPSKPITLEVRSSKGIVLGRGVARVTRPALVETGLHPTGKAGFQFELAQHLPLKKLCFFADGIAVQMAPTPQLRKRLRRAQEG